MLLKLERIFLPLLRANLRGQGACPSEPEVDRAEATGTHKEGLASEIGVAATTITKLARTDQKVASSLPLDPGGGILAVLEVGRSAGEWRKPDDSWASFAFASISKNRAYNVTCRSKKLLSARTLQLQL